ncbi:hypothetical protein ACIHCQ_21635 [Streptomyces sp. NPDC052236]|uniref:hypothetical protein n=1 Tax=Streptomyces sp. NPDC052236 TaxID=3365686 RepID=UPI0037D7395E
MLVCIKDGLRFLAAAVLGSVVFLSVAAQHSGSVGYRADGPAPVKLMKDVGWQ